MSRWRYRDRAEAGRTLATLLSDYRNSPGLLVLGLARGGVPVAAEIARALGADLDVAIVRKLGAPRHEELALGAISAQHMVLNEELVRAQAVSPDALDAVVERERSELARRAAAYRSGRATLDLRGRTVILVDDGLATGATMHVAVLDARAAGAAAVVVAVPTAPSAASSEFRCLADDFVCPHTPEPFPAVGASYRRFNQVDDTELLAELHRGSGR